MNLTTEDQLAESFGIGLERVRLLRKRHHWPHVKIGRFDVRFTEEQIEQIVAQHTVAEAGEHRPGRVAVSGQTARSANRRRSA